MEFDPNSHLLLHRDCIPVRGKVRSSICDLSRHEIYLIPTDYLDLLSKLTVGCIGEVMANVECDASQLASVNQFIDFLLQHELAIFVESPSTFPVIETRWESPSIVQNAIIDLDSRKHDFAKLFFELDELGCRTVQIRSYSVAFTLADVVSALQFAYHKSIEGIELILKYDPNVSDTEFVELVRTHPIVTTLIVHSCPDDRELVVKYGDDPDLDEATLRAVMFSSQIINSEFSCGLITLKSLTAPSVSTFFEAKLHNGCLNGKISVDRFGNIKNCPSMATAFGNIADTSLVTAVNDAHFKAGWGIRKDQIEICRDCEFRYVCSDCRAYLEKPEDEYSKPLKCGYDPYTSEWQDWSSNPLKSAAIEYYERLSDRLRCRE